MVAVESPLPDEISIVQYNNNGYIGLPMFFGSSFPLGLMGLPEGGKSKMVAPKLRTRISASSQDINEIPPSWSSTYSFWRRVFPQVSVNC
jgi:hypothetical protein